MRYLIYILFCFAPVLLRAQTPQWEWANSCGDQGLGWGYNTVSDNNGNLYLIGTFTDALDLGTISLTGNGNSDIFVAKYNSSGQLIWAKNAGGLNNDAGYGICLDNADNIYITGYFEDSAYFGNIEHFSNGISDIYLSKIDSGGNFIWTKTWGSINSDIGSTVHFNNAGFIVLGAQFNDVVNFSTYQLSSGAGQDIAIIKLDTAGTIEWAKQAGGSFASYVNGVSTDGTGNIYITGMGPTTSMNFDAITLTNVYFYVAKYDITGNAIWAKAAKGMSNHAVHGNAIQSDESGYTYVVGYTFEDQAINFGTITLNNDNAFIVKYSPTGSLLWAKNIGLNSNDALYDIALGNNNDVYVAGRYNTLGIFGNDTLQGYGLDDVLVAKFDSSGNHIWATHAGGSMNDGVYGITLDNNNIYVTGYINSINASFGSYNLSSSNSWDMFVAKLSQTTGVAEVAGVNKQLSIYPTPANDAVHVKGVQQNTTYRITNLTGSNVQHGELYKGINKIDITHLAKGMYLLYAGNEVHKIVKD